jgi:hypothetical protein
VELVLDVLVLDDAALPEGVAQLDDGLVKGGCLLGERAGAEAAAEACEDAVLGVEVAGDGVEFAGDGVVRESDERAVALGLVLDEGEVLLAR